MHIAKCQCHTISTTGKEFSSANHNARICIVVAHQFHFGCFLSMVELLRCEMHWGLSLGPSQQLG